MAEGWRPDFSRALGFDIWRIAAQPSRATPGRARLREPPTSDIDGLADVRRPALGPRVWRGSRFRHQTRAYAVTDYVRHDAFGRIVVAEHAVVVAALPDTHATDAAADAGGSAAERCHERPKADCDTVPQSRA